jgi:hypothetical protein
LVQIAYLLEPAPSQNFFGDALANSTEPFRSLSSVRIYPTVSYHLRTPTVCASVRAYVFLNATLTSL